ncbi:MAG: LytTR family DNA-binding domain-containing protein [Negativicutes bacterium]|nr:LytTR family DNA-binding domain-containing protein [Negativicutes bacterium]
MRYKAIIVDDEPPICDEIEYLLKREADVAVIGKFTNSPEALAYISQSACDLVFLDIKMPGLSGLELAQKLVYMRRPPLLVFITAFPEHALAAFETPAVGYITKPITESKLAGILHKIRSISIRSSVPDKPAINKICALKNGKIIPLDKQEIVFTYVREKDVFIRTKTGEYTAALTMQELEKALYEPNFLRVHRQYLVNLDKVQEIIPWFHGSFLLQMDDFNSEKVPVSRSKTKEIKAIMGLK